MGKYESDADVEVVDYEKKVPVYWGYAIVACIFNPLFGLIALICSWESSRCQKNGWRHARRYSDVSFGFSVISIISTILIILMVYASGAFPDNAYFDRNDVIRGYKTTMTVPTSLSTTIAGITTESPP